MPTIFIINPINFLHFFIVIISKSSLGYVTLYCTFADLLLCKQDLEDSPTCLSTEEWMTYFEPLFLPAVSRWKSFVSSLQYLEYVETFAGC